MTVGLADDHTGFAGRAGVRLDRAPSGPRRRVSRGRVLGVHVGQVVVTQVAVALAAAGAAQGTPGLVAGGTVAVALLLATWVRLRGRWAYEWLGTLLRYAGHRHTLPAGAGAAQLLDLVSPGARVVPAELAGDAAAVLSDAAGLTAVLELGDPAGLLAEALPPLPSPAALLPPAGSDSPPTTVQLLFSGVPAPALRAGAGIPATSYRQLTEGRVLGHARAVLAVRVLRAEGWSDDDLRRSLSGLVRKLPRRLGGVPARPLGEAAALRVLAELAHHDGAQPAQEAWQGLLLGGLAQATYRMRRWPDLRVETARRLVARLLTLPAAATTVAVAAGPRAPGGADAVTVDLTVRVAAPSEAELAPALQALRKLLAGEGADARRLDGEHLDGLAATLPLGGAPADVPAGVLPDTAVPPDALDQLDLPVSGGGLMLGSNRHGAPVIARLFRPEQTRAVLVGGIRGAQFVALRAMALGARVVVQTARPQAWEPFARGASVPGEAIAVVPPGRAVDIAPGTALHPLLVVVDVGPVGADAGAGQGWQTTLVVRDEFGPVDVDVAARADLLIFQPLRPDEAALAGSALGLGEAAQWLTRIRDDMVGVVNRRAVRWAALSPTPIESHLIGPPARD